jgi:nicotinamide mononucleotide transporter
MPDLYQQFLTNLKNTTGLEYVAVATGIASVWFSKKENILVYPVGLISTIIYIYLSFRNELIGEAAVNLFYTIMSIYGWILWSLKDRSRNRVLHITYSGSKEIKMQLAFFLVLYIAFYATLRFLQDGFYENVIPVGDSLATATAFTGMLLMARKKVESWYWWIATNIASIPLFYIKGMVVSSLYYAILLVLAFYGLMEWKQRALKKPVAKAAATGIAGLSGPQKEMN